MCNELVTVVVGSGEHALKLQQVDRSQLVRIATAETRGTVGKLDLQFFANKGSVFKQGEMFETRFRSKSGIEIGGLADVQINGKTLTYQMQLVLEK